MGKEYEYKGPEPLNREPEIKQLIGSFITEKDGYDRNHSEIPELDASNHRIRITGLVKQDSYFSIHDLKTQFAQHEVLCCLQCAGNRRHTMRTRIKEVHGVDWFDGAVMNCLWKGPRLRDVLLAIGIQDQLLHEKGYRGNVDCLCDVVPCQDAPNYGGSITLDRAMMEDGDCILALEMNGKPLTPAHGAPVRALFPGILGARSVKWLNTITVQLPESSHHYMQRDYKVLPPEATDPEAAEEFWDKAPPMSDMPVNSIIGSPQSGGTIKSVDGYVEVRGYALPGGMQGPVVSVQVSSDDGETWVESELDFGEYHQDDRLKIKWAWCLWKARVKIPKGTGGNIVSKATDFGGNVQPKDMEWNLRGVGYSAWGLVDNLNVIEDR